METFLVVPHLEQRIEIVNQKLVESECWSESSHTLKNCIKVTVLLLWHLCIEEGELGRTESVHLYKSFNGVQQFIFYCWRCTSMLIIKMRFSDLTEGYVPSFTQIWSKK